VPPGMTYFSELLVNASVTPVIRHRTASLELVRGLAASGASYSLLARHPAAGARDEERGLKSCRIRDEIPPLPVVLAWPSGAQFTCRAAAFAASCYASLALSREPEPRRR
jgi:LysR substrate binding domain